MQIYISWSKTLSKLVAEEMESLLVGFFEDRVKPFSSLTIDSGADWFYKNQNHLHSADLGLILVSRRGLDSPWLLYEGGALLNRLPEDYCQIILLDVKATDLKDFPFYHLQCTDFLSRRVDIFQWIASKLTGAGSNFLFPSQRDDVLNAACTRISRLCRAEHAFISILETGEREASRKKALIKNACAALVESGLTDERVIEWLKKEEIPEAAYAPCLAELWRYTRR